MVWKDERICRRKVNRFKTSQKKWDKISSIAWSNAQTVWKGTSKWFGKAESVTGKLTDMKDFASGKWDAISSIAWSNAKSVWSGTSKWFEMHLVA